MTRDEVLKRLDRMAQHWYELDEREGITDGPYATALRAAAELIRAGGWRPIAEAPEGKELRVGCYCGDRWFRPWYGVDKAYAIAQNYTHYLPEPAPPALADLVEDIGGRIDG